MRSSMGHETNKKKKARETRTCSRVFKNRTAEKKSNRYDILYIILIIMNDISKSDIFPSDIPTGWALKVICSRLLFFLVRQCTHFFAGASHRRVQWTDTMHLYYIYIYVCVSAYMCMCHVYIYLLHVFEFVSENLLYSRWVVFNVIPVVFVYVVRIYIYISHTLTYKRITHICAVYTRVLGSSQTVALIHNIL